MKVGGVIAVFAGVFAAFLLARKESGIFSSETEDPVYVSLPPDDAVIDNSDGTVYAPDYQDQIPVASVPENVVTFTDALISKVKDATAGTAAMLFGTKYDSLINASAMQAGIEPALLYKLLYQESRFREDIITGKVKSPAGALGIAQFMPATALQELGSVAAALDPNQAVPGAARYLAKLIRQTGSVEKGVAAYNWGIGNVTKKGLASAPAETRQYVLNITGTSIA